MSADGNTSRAAPEIRARSVWRTTNSAFDLSDFRSARPDASEQMFKTHRVRAAKCKPSRPGIPTAHRVRLGSIYAFSGRRMLASSAHRVRGGRIQAQPPWKSWRAPGACRLQWMRAVIVFVCCIALPDAGVHRCSRAPGARMGIQAQPAWKSGTQWRIHRISPRRLRKGPTEAPQTLRQRSANAP